MVCALLALPCAAPTPERGRLARARTPVPGLGFRGAASRGVGARLLILAFAAVAAGTKQPLPAAAAPGCFWLRGGASSSGVHSTAEAASTATSASTDSDSDDNFGERVRVEGAKEGGGLDAFLRQHFPQADDDDGSGGVQDKSTDSRGSTKEQTASGSSGGAGHLPRLLVPGREGRKRRLEHASESSSSLPETASVPEQARSNGGKDDPAGGSENSLGSDSAASARNEPQKRSRQLAPNLREQEAPVYQDTRPMVCKEFAEKGVCRYGLTCIFLHDRTSYYDKWKEKVLERRRSAKLATFQAKLISEHCSICKDSYTEPVVTLCDHYFCSRCIIERYENADGDAGAEGTAESALAAGLLCPLCSEPLNGIFNLAYDLQDRLHRQQLKQLDPSKITVRSRLAREVER
jgi:RING finger protein 113A